MLKRSRLSNYKQSKLLELFIAGATGRVASELAGVNKTTACYYFHRLREIIYSNINNTVVLDGEIEVDESYFGGHRKGKRGRGAAGKIPVFGLLKRGGKVYAVMVEDTKSATLVGIIKDKVTPDSIVYSDTYKSYNALDVTDFQHHRINKTKTFAKGHNHINGIENFWNQAKRHLRKFNGIPKEHFHLYLKECEWRFNCSNSKSQITQLKQWVKEYKR